MDSGITYTYFIPGTSNTMYAGGVYDIAMDRVCGYCNTPMDIVYLVKRVYTQTEILTWAEPTYNNCTWLCEPCYMRHVGHS